MSIELVECEKCNGSGFSKVGTGYDSVCDNCGGLGKHPKYYCKEVSQCQKKNLK